MARKLYLTPRWTPLKPHAMQSLFMWHPAPIKVCPAGRRSGKTELVKRKAVLKLRKRLAWPGRYAIGAPTLEQVRRIYWEDIKALTPPKWIASINETRMEIRTRWGAVLQLLGLDRPQRAEGTPWDWMAIDELADCAPKLLQRHLMPAMGTLGRTPSLDLIGVPDEVGPNQAEYEMYWQTGLNWRPGLDRYTEKELEKMGASPSVCSFHWRSEDIIEPEKMAFYRATMDEFEFEQEFGGRFLTSGGKALPRFDPVTHVSEYFAEYCPRRPLDWSFDFGVGSHGVALVGQEFNGNVWIMDEIITTDGSTDVLVSAFRERCEKRGYQMRNMRLFGDAAGHNRHSNTGESDYAIIEQLTRGWPLERRELTSAPLIKDSLNAVRGRTMSADGRVRLHIHPRCKTLIEQCKVAPWPSKLEEFHCLAALRYYLFELFGDVDNAGMSTGQRTLPGLPVAPKMKARDYFRGIPGAGGG